MQPYFLPYLGYWQLLKFVDRFVLYDDVNYIKRGWVNRNRILINGEPRYITVPVRSASQNRSICEHLMDDSTSWRELMLKSIDGAYRKAPAFLEVFPIISEVISYDTNDLATYLRNQIEIFAKHLNIDTQVVPSSKVYGNSDLAGPVRILDICAKEAADSYINPEGGQSLYDPEGFRRAGVTLRFIKAQPKAYPQSAPQFIPHLSIVDVLMSQGWERTGASLSDFTLIDAAAKNG